MTELSLLSDTQNDYLGFIVPRYQSSFINTVYFIFNRSSIENQYQRSILKLRFRKNLLDNFLVSINKRCNQSKYIECLIGFFREKINMLIKFYVKVRISQDNFHFVGLNGQTITLSRIVFSYSAVWYVFQKNLCRRIKNSQSKTMKSTFLLQYIFISVQSSC